MARLLPSRPGWYLNPIDRSRLRYWDGRKWTGEHRPRPPWVTGLAGFNAPAASYNRALEGPVHPHELREPVTSGAWSLQGQLSWKAWPYNRPWHQGGGFSVDDSGPQQAPAGNRLGPVRRPLAAFVAVVVVAVAVAIPSFAVLAPREGASTARFPSQPAMARFVAQASRECSPVLPQYRSVLLSNVDGPRLVVATHQLSLLRQRLATLHPTSDFEAPVEAWLGDLGRLATLDDRYASILGSAGLHDSRATSGSLSVAAAAAALQAHTQAVAVARQADHYASNLQITECMLERPGLNVGP